MLSESILTSQGYPDFYPSRPGFGQAEDILTEEKVKNGFSAKAFVAVGVSVETCDALQQRADGDRRRASRCTGRYTNISLGAGSRCSTS
jgi:hypothetical protein